MNAGTILIVDDNPNNLKLLAGLLRESDYDVRMASNGKRALVAARQSPPELVMLDITMPEMDGYEVCVELKADPATSAIPVIFISALDDVLDKVRAFKTGGVDYVTKPFQADEVLARVESQIQLYRLRRELEKRNEELLKKNQELVQSQRQVDRVFSALADVLPGTILDGKYRLESKIGRGGFGAVYRGSNVRIDRPVAVKIFRPGPGGDSPDGFERFRLEGVSACKIDHPNAVSVLDSGVSTSGIAYLVMELLTGRSLRDEMRERGPLPLARCAEVLLPVCDVLAQAHAARLVHRDIKPDNIFLHQAAGREVVKVVDFGIAKLIEGAGDASLTVTGDLIGTPLFMAPERFLNNPYDGRSDVYSVAVMLYQMLSAVFPYAVAGLGIYAAIAACATQEPRPLRDAVAGIPPALDALVARSLSKNAADRPTAAEFGAELSAAAGLGLWVRTAASGPGGGRASRGNDLSAFTETIPVPDE
jgi:CheY-like chemotaxis protein